MSSFDGVDLFGSGPQRFVEGPSGVQVESNSRSGPGLAGSRAIGLLEPRVTVRGRLVAASDVGLNGLVAAIRGKLTFPPTVGTLVDQRGRVWTGIGFIGFTPLERTDRGRRVSLEYEAEFASLIG